MREYQVVIDSTGELLTKDNIVNVPLNITIGDKDFIDDENLNIEELLKAKRTTRGKQSTSCPSPLTFEEIYKQAKKTVVVTLSNKLSGTYNSAVLAKDELSEEYEVEVIDSLSAAGVQALIANDALELLKKGLSPKEVKEKIDVKKYNVLFVLERFQNLVNTGRMSRMQSIFASLIKIRPILTAEEGEIKLYKKIRTTKRAFSELVTSLEELMPEINNGGECVISHCENIEVAKNLKKDLEEKYKKLNIVIRETRGISSFYAEEKGVIVSFRSNYL